MYVHNTTNKLNCVLLIKLMLLTQNLGPILVLGDNLIDHETQQANSDFLTFQYIILSGPFVDNN